MTRGIGIDRIGQLTDLERAALETLATEVVLPVRQRGSLLAFLCLGPKRSKDIYTRTDLALLAAVAGTISTELARFGEAEVAREARSMQLELSRYVPGAVASLLAAGKRLTSGTRPVSVLFVDIRGYTAYSENRAPEEVFSTINHYTTTVSSIVDKFDGNVVEFNGDGLMAVWGAFQPLSNKETAAVAAGKEIVGEVQSISESESDRGGLSVGVGIATGPAFVGTVRAVDRMIWTVLGDTTNLAARLQTLTRDLEASIVIDETTWRSAGDVAVDFVRRAQVAIRGRSRYEDVYLYPMAQSSTAQVRLG